MRKLAISLLACAAFAAAADVQDVLSGTWILRKGSGTSYVNEATGQHGAPNATVHRYTFRPNGRFEYAMLMQSSLYGCTSAINGFEEGTYSVEPDGIRVVTRSATKSYADNCRPHLNEKGPAAVRAAETLQYRFFRDQAGVHLCMWRTGGGESCFLKQ